MAVTEAGGPEVQGPGVQGPCVAGARRRPARPASALAQGATRPLASKAACVSGMIFAHSASIFSATISISRCGKDGEVESSRRVRKDRKFIRARALQVAYI